MHDMIVEESDKADVAGGCVAAIVVPAAVTGFAFAALMLDVGLSALVIGAFAAFCAAFVATFHVLLLGLPAYLLVSRSRAPGWLLSGASGMVLGGVPIFVLSRGWTGEDLSPTAICGFMGLIGGLSFRWKLYPRQ